MRPFTLKIFGLSAVVWICILPFLCEAAEEVTPSVVFARTIQIAEEIEILKRHFKVREIIKVKEVKTNLKPRHVWQKTYEILVKINILRAKQGLPILAVNSLEPVKNLDPILVYEQAKRILLELEIIKLRLNIEEKRGRLKTFTGKTPSDVFNKLNFISREMDLINGESFTPSAVFSQSMRLLEDVVTIINALDIKDDTIPPTKNLEAKSEDTFHTGFALLQEIQRLHRMSGMELTDFSHFKTGEITPTRVFDLTEMMLAELQVVKAHIGLKHAMTPPAKHYEEMVPGDVQQILGWALRKMKLIKSLH